MRVLLLGATGLIGRAVAERFAAAGHRVAAVMRDPSRAPAPVAEAIKGDLAAPEGWLDHLETADAFVHCACDWQGDMAETEARLIEGLIARGSRGRILYTGGVWCFGEVAGPITEETPHAPSAAFDWDVQSWHRLIDAGADAVWVHPGLVWHETAPHHAPIREALRAGAPVPVLAPGDQLQPLIHASDLAEGYLAALEHGRAGRDYLFVGEHQPMARVAALWARNHGLETVSRAAAPGDPYAWSQRIGTARAEAELGWRPKVTSIAAALGA